MWSTLEAVAPTLAYDAAALGPDRTVPTRLAAGVNAPALVMNGGAGFPFMAKSAREIAAAMPMLSTARSRASGMTLTPMPSLRFWLNSLKGDLGILSCKYMQRKPSQILGGKEGL